MNSKKNPEGTKSRFISKIMLKISDKDNIIKATKRGKTHTHSCMHAHTREYTSYGLFTESSQGSHMKPMQMCVLE